MRFQIIGVSLTFSTLIFIFLNMFVIKIKLKLNFYPKVCRLTPRMHEVYEVLENFIIIIGGKVANIYWAMVTDNGRVCRLDGEN